MARLGVAATAPFGADVLERLASRHEIVFCLTRPDRPRGRGRRIAPPPAKDFAERLGIPVLQPERLGQEVELPAEDVVVVAYGQLVPAQLLDAHAWWNVHPSLLPRWRGAAPVERAIMAGDRETGVTIIRLVEELDAGPIAAQRALPIEPDDDAGAVYAKAAPVAVELLDEALATRSLHPQPTGGITYADKIGPADREIDWCRSADQIVDHIRALSPHIGARAELHGRPVTIWRACVEDGQVVPLEIQPDGGRRMTYREWLRGLR